MQDAKPPSSQRQLVEALTRPSNMLSLLLITAPYQKERFIAGGWNEYELTRRPKSLEQFVDLFRCLDDDEYAEEIDQRRYIRVPVGSFVSVSTSDQPRDLEPSPISAARPYQESQFRIVVGNQPKFEFTFWSATALEATRCLEFLLVELPNSFERLEIKSNLNYILPSLCPLNPVHLTTVLRNRSGRTIRFHKTSFMAEHCRALATCGTNTCVELSECELLDRGEAFVEAFAGRVDETAGVSKLVIDNSSLFDYDNWQKFLLLLMDRSLEFLSLKEQYLSNEELAALASARVEKVELESCTMEDGAELIEMVKKGHGPRHLSLNDAPLVESITSEEWWGSFADALSGNTYLEGLSISQPSVDELPSSLVECFSKNKGLVELGFSFVDIGKKRWDELMVAIAEHPKLRRLKFEGIVIPDDDAEELSVDFIDRENVERIHRTETLAETLRSNRRIEDISFDDETFDEAEWKKTVVPLLQMNRYRKNFETLQTAEMNASRPALLGSAMASVANTPSLVNTLLSRNLDSLLSHLRQSPLSFKRGAGGIPLPIPKRIRCVSSETELDDRMASEKTKSKPQKGDLPGKEDIKEQAVFTV